MPNIRFATIRLGKNSVEQINEINLATPGVQNPPISFDVVCTQVQQQIEAGIFVIVWLGSDNNKGQPTSWVQGIRAIGRLVGIERGESFNDQSTLHIEVRIVLPHSIPKRDFLAKAPTAYYWFSGMPVLGIDDYSNQLARYIDHNADRNDVKALFYAIEAASPGFQVDINSSYPMLSGMFNYTPPDPTSRVGIFEAAEIDDSAGETSEQPVPSLLPVEWLLALCSKGFLIVTGRSGTGKTKTARDIARALDYKLPTEFKESRTKPANCSAFIPVGANWNNPTPLLGFRNPFGSEITVKISENQESTINEEYDPPPALLLLLRAVDRPEHPHFLVLDEMNLSHVERYFYPFLSIIEANRGLDAQSKIDLLDNDTLRLIALSLEAKNKNPLEAAVARRLWTEGLSLSFPANVFVIGTVNVDETTYMFSPKVLDRANVIEARPQNPAEYFSGTPTSSDSLISRDSALNLLRISIQRNRGGFWERKHPKDVLEAAAIEKGLGSNEYNEIFAAIQKTFKGVNTLLEPVGFGFAQRTVNEFTAYMAVFLEINDGTIFGLEGWKAALDRAVSQKLLPKIHGNRRQLGQSLKALAAFLKDSKGDAASYKQGLNRIEVPVGEGLGFALPISVAKVEHMDQKLEATGYTTFVE